MRKAQGSLAASVIETAQLQQRRGKWEEALRLVEAARQNVEAAEPKWAARLAAREGSLLVTQARRRTGDWNRAITALEAAVAQARTAGDPQALGTGLDQLGLALHHRTLFTRQGDYVAAQQALTEALKVQTAARDDRAVSQILFHLGICAEHAGQRDEAFRVYRRSLALAERTRDQEGIARGHRHLGSLYQTSKEWPRSLDHFEKALAATRRAGDQLGLAAALHALADAMIAAGQPPAGPRRVLEEALAHATQLKDLAYVARIQLSLGRLAQTAGPRDAAPAHLREALRTAETIKDAETADEARQRLAELAAAPVSN